ncbi:MAG: hypothetical protein WBH82_00635 [Arcanobacterium sp.]
MKSLTFIDVNVSTLLVGLSVGRLGGCGDRLFTNRKTLLIAAE